MNLKSAVFTAALFFVGMAYDFSNAFTHEVGERGIGSRPKEKYPLKDAYQKLTDNHGNGFDDLYGTRNFRVILHGVAYRGGANNAFHKQNPKPNMNPLPVDGLHNLCREGFSQAIYLYSENFDTAPTETACETGQSQPNLLRYAQLKPIEPTQVQEMLWMIAERIRNPELGPIYLHCWNGWHASGLISALALRQFCGLSPEAAVAYWDRNTDGFNKEAQYEKIRERIRNFVPDPNLILSPKVAGGLCPVL